jgi:hypothetical protein
MNTQTLCHLCAKQLAWVPHQHACTRVCIRTVMHLKWSCLILSCALHIFIFTRQRATYAQSCLHVCAHIGTIMPACIYAHVGVIMPARKCTHRRDHAHADMHTCTQSNHLRTYVLVTQTDSYMMEIYARLMVGVHVLLTKCYGVWSNKHKPWLADIWLSCLYDAGTLAAGGVAGGKQTFCACVCVLLLSFVDHLNQVDALELPGCLLL